MTRHSIARSSASTVEIDGRELLYFGGCDYLGLAHHPRVVAALVEGAAPYWMVALWALFATTLNVSLRWLRARPWLGALLGALGGPAAYYAGARLGALELATAGAGLGAIAIGWAVLTPLLLGTARRLDGYARP